MITNTDLITLTVTVTDTYGRYVSGLSKSAFAIFDNKQQQEITFFSDDDSPVSVGVIFDVSGSMSGDKVKRARDALSKFIQTSHDSDEYFLIAFNSRAQLLLDRTRDGDSILNKLTFVETKSQTALYDACYLGVEKVQRGAHPKRALLLISDGQDNDSRYTFNEVRKLLKESDVTLYAIGILSGNDAGSALGMEGQGVLDELSGVSGGKAFFPRSAAEMDDIFEQIALELRHQYSIGYKPESFLERREVASRESESYAAAGPAPAVCSFQGGLLRHGRRAVRAYFPRGFGNAVSVLRHLFTVRGVAVATLFAPALPSPI